MTAAWTWLRFDLRARARSLVVLALLVALATAVVLTAVAGARRGSSAVERLADQTRPATVAALPNEPGFDWEAVERLPNVAAVARFPVSLLVADDLPPEAVNFAYGDDAMIDLERPVVLEGRLADPTRDDEAVITQAFEGTFGKGVGDTVVLRLPTPAQVDEHYLSPEAPAPDGPAIRTTIVGIVRSPWFSDSEEAAGGSLIPSNGLFAQHAANLVGNDDTANVNALVRLEGGARDVPQFREDLAELTGRRDIEFFDLAAEAAHAREVADFEADALLAFAAAALLASIFVVGQSVVRYVSGSASELEVLASLGMPRRHRRFAALAGPTVVALVGATAGAGVAWFASSSFPIGTAAPYEPDPGRQADPAVLVGGLLLASVLVIAGAWFAAASSARTSRTPSRARSRVAEALARSSAPVPMTIGTGFALDPGQGPRAVPVRPALLGSVVGVVGVVGALTFAAGVDDAAGHPERFGQFSQLQVFLGFNGEDFAPPAAVGRALAEDRDVVAVNDTRQGVLESGPVDLAAFVIDPVGARPPIVTLDGRLPSGRHEVALATGSAQRLEVGPGDEIELRGSAGVGTYAVSGIAFVPEGSHNAYDEGAWVSPDAYDDLIDGFKFRVADVSLRPGVDATAAAERLGPAVAEAIGAPSDAGGELIEVRPPPARLRELQQIQSLPLLLAAFLAVLGVAAVGHAMATAVRRRRGDLAVLRALGVTRGQSRVILLAQGTTLALAGLVSGVPLGFALGRALWRSVAETTPLEHIPPVALGAMVLIAPVTLLLANLLAAWPSHRAATMRVAHVLRTE